ncbi:MAG: Trm112 family protein [Gammaproteobacteria bacterium]|nr:Trm112 family protein [Gammaproteobacteria bacterium]
MMDKKLLNILVCPESKAPLTLSKDGNELICYASGLAYPIREDIPVLLADEARALTTEEKLVGK